MMFCRRVFFLSLLTFVWGAVAQCDDGVVLRHKFVKGSDAIYKNSMKLTQKQTVMGMAIETVMDNTVVTRQSVDEVDSKGEAKLRIKNEQMLMKMNIRPVFEYVFDSKKTDNDKSSQAGASLTPVLERLVGTESGVEIDGLGKIVKATGQRDQIKDLLENNPLAAQTLSMLADEKAAKATLQDSFTRFPDKPLKVGDSWEIDDETDLGIAKTKLKQKYTVEAADEVAGRKTLRIQVSVTGTIEIDTNQGGQKVSGTLSVNKGSGTLQFDPVAGQTVIQKSEVEFGGQVQVDVNGMTLLIPTEQKQEVSRELLDKLP